MKRTILLLTTLTIILGGCGKSNEDQLKELRGHAAGTFLLIQASSANNFQIIANVGTAWVEYGVDGGESMSEALGKNASDLDEVGDFMNKMRPNQNADPELYEAVKDLYNVAQEVHQLATDAGGYSLITYAAKVKSLRNEFDLKAEEVERLIK